MKKQTPTQPRIKWPRLAIFLALGLSLWPGSGTLSWAIDWQHLPWGLTLDQLNQAYQKKYPSGRIKEDYYRAEIELQYSPGKSIKIKRGELTAMESSKDSSSSYCLLGYSYEGKFFGQVVFFKDYPELFPETINSVLRKEYPEGKLIQTFGASRAISSYQVKTEALYLFTNEKGVFLYEPAVLTKVVTYFQELRKKEIELSEKPYRERSIE